VIPFLKHVLPGTGLYCATVFAEKNVSNKFFDSIDELSDYVALEDRNGNSVYFACASYKQWGVRKQTNVLFLKSFYLDIEGGPEAVATNKGYDDAVAAYRAVLDFCRRAGLPEPTMVASGHGLHIYWVLEQELSPQEWLPYARGLKRKAKELGLCFDPSRTADAASILRPPDTHNRKRGGKIEVRCSPLTGPYPLSTFACLHQEENHVFGDADAIAAFGSGEHYACRKGNLASLCLANLGGAPTYSSPIAERCAQIRHFRDIRGCIPEPDWHACICVLRFTEDGNEKIHLWSSGYENKEKGYAYSKEETDKKIEDSIRSGAGPRTCKWFEENTTNDFCKGCFFRGKIKSPISLGYERTQASDDERVQLDPQANQPGQAPHYQIDREDDDGAQPRKEVRATPFAAFDFAKIPPRQWLYGRHYIRQYVTATVASGGSAKTALKLVEVVSMAISRDLLNGDKSIHRQRVWYWNGEDPQDEIERCIAAICLHYKIEPKELEGWLFLDTGHEMPICLATENRGTVTVSGEVFTAINETLKLNNINVLVIDPFISIHRVSENNNALIDQVVKSLGRIAKQNDCAIEIVHHVRKPAAGQQEITADDTRGGGAIVNAVRSCQVLNRMSNKEAEQARIKQDERFRYFRVDSGKQNLAPPEKAKWRYLGSVDIPNGDNVQVVGSWQFPEAVNAVTQEEIEFIRATAQAGVHNRWDTRAKSWIGRALADRLGLDPQNKADREDIRAKLNACRKSGIITIEQRQDAKRRVREYVVAGQAMGSSRPAV
jgi:AAA domain